MSAIVRDQGFAAEDWTGAIAPLAERTSEPGVDVVPGDDMALIEALAAPAHGVSGLTGDLDRRHPTYDGEAPDHLRGAAVGTQLEMIRIAFPAFSDGRGFTIARRLRQIGYRGRLRAFGHVLADQYAMARRSGFDEVEIDDDLARRQPEPQWLARANWRAHDYRSRLGARSFAPAD